LRLVDDLAVRGARGLPALRAQTVERTGALERQADGLGDAFLHEKRVEIRLAQGPDAKPSQEEHARIAGPEGERKARESRKVEHELGRELDVVRAVTVPASQRAEEPLSRVEEEDVVAVADDRLTPELADRHRGAREDHVRRGGDAVQPVPAPAFGRTPELSEDEPLVFEQGPVDRVCLHLFVQTSNGRRSSNWHAEIVRDGLAI